MTSQPESRLSRAIMAELRGMGAFAFKVHGGPTMMAGLPDIIACIPVDVWTTEAYERAAPETMGLFVGIETKMPGNHTTAIQRARHHEIEAAGGRVYVPHSVAEAMDWVRTVADTPDDR